MSNWTIRPLSLRKRDRHGLFWANSEYADECVVPVTSKCPVAAHRLVQQAAVYFKMECHYDLLQYTAPALSFLAAMHVDIHPYLVGLPHEMLDRGQFRGGLVVVERKSGPALTWMWLHPYARNNGLGSKVVTQLTVRHPGLVAEPPLSLPMQRIVASGSIGVAA